MSSSSLTSLPPPLASPPRVCEHARGPVFSRRPGPLRLRLSSGGGRRPSLPPSPLARCVVSRPAGSRSPVPARSGSGFIPLSPRRCASPPRVWGGPPRPHTRSRAPARGRRLGTRGVVSRRGASRGSASVSRRLGGSRRVASPGSGHPPPSSRSSLPLVRPRLAVPCSLPAAVCVGGISGDIPVVPSGGRRPRFSSLSPPACGVFRPPRAPLARSRASRPRSTAGRPDLRPGRPAGLARAPTWLILPVAYACLKD